MHGRLSPSPELAAQIAAAVALSGLDPSLHADLVALGREHGMRTLQAVLAYFTGRQAAEAR